MECDGEGRGSEPGEREGVENAAGDRARVLGVAIDPEFENPIGTEVGGHFEGEADTGEEAKGENEGHGEKFDRGIALRQEGIETLRSVEGLGGCDEAECCEGKKDLEVGFASQKSGGGEAEGGAVRWSSEEEFLERRKEREREARRDTQLGERAGVAGLGDADEGAAEAESVGDGGDDDCGGKRFDGGGCHLGDERFVAAAPNCTGDGEKRDWWKLGEGSNSGKLGLFEESGDGERRCEQEKKCNAEEKTDEQGDAAEKPGGENGHE